MHPGTHFLLSWLVANTAKLERRDRALVALTGLAPDADGLVLVVDWATKGSAHPTNWWEDYHHIAGHNLALSLVVTGVCVALAKRRGLTAALAFAAFQLHVACDYVGSRGPDGYAYPIEYLFPFADAAIPPWSGQWELNAWPNFVVTGAALAITLYLAWRRGFSPVGIVSERVDRAVVRTLRDRFGAPRASA